MSDEKSASQVAIELLQEAYEEVEAKNYSAALQRCQAALAIYQKIGDRTGVAYTLATIADICRLSLESLLPQLEESNLPRSGESNFLLLEPNIESPPSPEISTKSLRIRIERGEVDPGPPPRPSRLIIEIHDRPRGEVIVPPTPTPILRPPSRLSQLVIELRELEPPSPPSPSP